MKPDVRFHLYDREGGASVAIGPGKIALLEAIAETGSISAAARRLGMSYRRAWLLVDETNHSLASPAVAALTGGSHGGGAALTSLGTDLVARYRAIEKGLRHEVDGGLAPLLGSVARRTTETRRRAPDGDPGSGDGGGKGSGVEDGRERTNKAREVGGGSRSRGGTDKRR